MSSLYLDNNVKSDSSEIFPPCADRVEATSTHTKKNPRHTKKMVQKTREKVRKGRNRIKWTTNNTHIKRVHFSFDSCCVFIFCLLSISSRVQKILIGCLYYPQCLGNQRPDINNARHSNTRQIPKSNHTKMRIKNVRKNDFQLMSGNNKKKRIICLLGVFFLDFAIVKIRTFNNGHQNSEFEEGRKWRISELGQRIWADGCNKEHEARLMHISYLANPSLGLTSKDHCYLVFHVQYETITKRFLFQHRFRFYARNDWLFIDTYIYTYI